LERGEGLLLGCPTVDERGSLERAEQRRPPALRLPEGEVPAAGSHHEHAGHDHSDHYDACGHEGRAGKHAILCFELVPMSEQSFEAELAGLQYEKHLAYSIARTGC